MPATEKTSGNRFVDRHVAVTGGSRGIGRALAVAFAAEGARLSVFSRSEGAGSYPCDITDRAQVEAAVEQARRRSGEFDVLVNNAGIFLWKPFLETSPEECDRVIATNLGGAFNFCRAVLPKMVERRTGRIVNISSIHGLHGDANLAAHCAAKFGLIGLTQALAKEFRSYNVTVNAICPGTTENRPLEEESAPRPSPLSAKLRPQDVAAAVLWLCSEEAAGITGASIEVYGGTQIRIQP
jgi:2-hydroxycyclohexanecarboxyl-CoA dehydrogenase